MGKTFKAPARIGGGKEDYRSVRIGIREEESLRDNATGGSAIAPAMEAVPVDNLPTGKGWLFEPKYDGFRSILFRDCDEVNLQSRRQRPLGRYFPEIVEAARHLSIQKFIFDGELLTIP